MQTGKLSDPHNNGCGHAEIQNISWLLILLGHAQANYDLRACVCRSQPRVTVRTVFLRRYIQLTQTVCCLVVIQISWRVSGVVSIHEGRHVDAIGASVIQYAS